MYALHTQGGVSRRRVLVSGTGVALGVSALAACGGDDGSAETSPTPTSSGDTGVLAEVTDVPVGGAVAATGSDGKPVIVAQPTEGTIVAFSAVCTHQGCTVAPADTNLLCPCHGSTFDPGTGENTGGPAPAPLAEIPVKIEGNQVIEA